MHFFPLDRALRPESLHHSRGVAASGFRPLRKIPHCCLPQESGPCLSSSVADHPLRPANHRSLGRPLPYQLANGTQTHLMTEGPKVPPFSRSVQRLRGLIRYQHLFRSVIPDHQADYLRVTHPCATKFKSKLSNSVRLACVRHAASVRSEPGSNSPVYNESSITYSQNLLLAKIAFCSYYSQITLISAIRFSKTSAAARTKPPLQPDEQPTQINLACQ